MQLNFESHLFQVTVFIIIKVKFASSPLINLDKSCIDKIKYQKTQGMLNGSVYSGLQFEEEEESACHVGTYARSQSYF